MIGPLSPATATRLEKAAIDNGFDQELPAPEGWLGFASTQAPLRIWLTALGDDLFLVTLSQLHVARALYDPQEDPTHRVDRSVPGSRIPDLRGGQRRGGQFTAAPVRCP